MAGNDSSFYHQYEGYQDESRKRDAELLRLREKSSSDDLAIQALKDLVIARQVQIDDLSEKLASRDGRLGKLEAFLSSYDRWDQNEGDYDIDKDYDALSKSRASLE